MLTSNESIIPEPAGESTLTKETATGVALNVACEPMPDLPRGSFTRTDDGRILTVAYGSVFVSDDEGESWEERPAPFFPDAGERDRSAAVLTTTAEGTVVCGFVDSDEMQRTWDDDLNDAPGATLPAYAIRSTDGGDTWQDKRLLSDGYAPEVRDAIRTSDGAIVLASQVLLHEPGRNGVVTYRSTDDGKTWEQSNIIDLGGCGDHGGVYESTLVELDDGRLLQYLRTNWHRYWTAISEDDGRSWHPYGPSGIDASTAPAMLKRLESGRIALLWNRTSPEGQAIDDYSEWERGGDCSGSATSRSCYREELSISFSEDECESWSPPVILARDPGGAVDYPYVFEHEPGSLWISSVRQNVAVEIQEQDFLR